jgi:hypothetical protein
VTRAFTGQRPRRHGGLEEGGGERPAVGRDGAGGDGGEFAQIPAVRATRAWRDGGEARALIDGGGRNGGVGAGETAEDVNVASKRLLALSAKKQ